MQKYVISYPQNQILTITEKLHKKHKPTRNLFNGRFFQSNILKIIKNEFFAGFI